MLRKGRLSTAALAAARATFTSEAELESMRNAPDGRWYVPSSRVAGVHPELAALVRERGARMCVMFGRNVSYRTALHSDSSVIGMWSTAIMLAGTKRVRVTPLENVLAWPHTHAGGTPWVHLHDDEHKRRWFAPRWREASADGVRSAGGARSRGSAMRRRDLWHRERFSAGDVFALHGVHVHGLQTRNGREGYNLMLSCRDTGYDRHPFGWLAALRNVRYAGAQAIDAVRVTLTSMPGGA